MGNGGTTGSVTPVALTALPAASAVSIGNGQSCVLLAGGEARCWGANSTGQLGDGTKTVRTTPVQVLP